MKKGKEYVIKKLQEQCANDSSYFNNQKQIYFDAMLASKHKLLEIVQASDSKQVEEQIKEIENLDKKIQAVDDVLNDVKKILEYDV